MSKRALVVVNPRAANANEGNVEAARASLEHHGIAVDVATGSAERPVGHIIEARGRDVDIIVVAGGDGTIRSAARSLIDLDRPVGILPFGTANDLARGLGIPSDPAQAAEVVAAGRTTPIDVAFANGEPFFNSAGIGLGSVLTEEMDPVEKSAFGVLAYVSGLRRALGKHRPFRAEIECDDERLRLRCIQVTVANGKYYGGGMTVHRDALLDDNRLDLIVIRTIGFWRFLKLVPKLRWAVEHDPPELVTRRAAHIRVETKWPVRVSTDGELTTETPVDFTIEPKRIHVFVTPRADAVDSDSGRPAHAADVRWPTGPSGGYSAAAPSTRVDRDRSRASGRRMSKGAESSEALPRGPTNEPGRGTAGPVPDTRGRAWYRRGHASLAGLLATSLDFRLCLLHRRPLPARRPGVAGPYRFELADRERLAHMTREPELDIGSEFVATALDRGDICFVATHAGRPIAYYWLSTRGRVPLDGPFELEFDASTYAYAYKMFTHPDFRGRRIQQANIAYGDRVCLERGITHVLGYVESHNYHSKQLLRRLPELEYLGFVGVARLFGEPRTFRSPGARRHSIRLSVVDARPGTQQPSLG